MAKYDIHVLDPEVLKRSWDLYSDADWYKQAADQLYVNQPLGDIGRGEIAKIGAGQFGSTLMGGALKQQAGRDIEAAKRSNTLGAAAMMRAGNTPGSMGASILYDRMLQKQIGEIQDRASDRLSQALPGYVSQAGAWAEAPNRNIAQKASMMNLYDQSRINATQLRQSNMRFDKKKSFWDKLKEGVAFAGDLVGLATGFGSLSKFGGGGGGNSGPYTSANATGG